MKKLVCLILSLVMILSLAACGAPAAPAPANDAPKTDAPADAAPADAAPETPKERIPMSIGGSNPGGTAYVVGTAYADVINANVPYLNMTHEVTAGGKENIELVQNGDCEFGCGFSAFLYEAYNGIGDYEGKPHDKLRALIPWFQYPVQICVPADSDIQCIQDLRGKRVGINVKGAGGYKSAIEIFGTLGLEEGVDYEPYYLAFQEACDAMKTGQLDAQIFTTGAPISSVVEMGTSMDFRMLAMSDEEMATIHEKYAYYNPGFMKAGTYSNIDYDVPTLMCYTVMWVSADVDDDVVYDVLSAIWNNRDTLALAHANQKELNEDLVRGGIIGIAPLHPGAERFYKEIGVI